MSTSPKITPTPAPTPEAAANHALHYWIRELHRLPAQGEAAQTVLDHARQALLLTARRGAAEEALAQLAAALHTPMITLGLVRTWAYTLDQLLHLRPTLLTSQPGLGDHVLSAWTAVGDWARVHTLLTTLQHQAPRDPLTRAQILYRQGSLLWMQGRWLPALRLAQQAWRLVPPAFPQTQVAIAALVALAVWRLGRRKQARRWCQRALTLCAPDDHLWRGKLHHYLFLTLQADHPFMAQRHLRLALDHLQAADALLPLAHLWADSTDLYLALGQRDQAVAALNQAYTLWRQTEDPAGLADYYRHAAIVAWATDHPNLARDYASYAAERWQALGVTSEVQRCQMLLQAFQR